MCIEIHDLEMGWYSTEHMWFEVTSTEEIWLSRPDGVVEIHVAGKLVAKRYCEGDTVNVRKWTMQEICSE
jgi:hypothetical protein